MKNFVVVGDQRYGVHTGSTYQIARRFAAMDYRVAWISGSLSPFQVFGARDGEDRRARRASWKRGGIGFADGRIWSYTPFTLLPIGDKPFLRSAWVMAHSDRRTIPGLSKVMARNGFGRADVLWLASSRCTSAAPIAPCCRNCWLSTSVVMIRAS